MIEGDKSLLTSAVSLEVADLLEVFVGALTPSLLSLSVISSFSFVTGVDTASGSSFFISGFELLEVGGNTFGEVATLVLSSSASFHPGLQCRPTYRAADNRGVELETAHTTSIGSD
jgi:hypothetical protein